MTSAEDTRTTREQNATEEAVWALLEAATEAAFDEYKLKRSLHVAYVKTNLFNAMPASFQTLDSNRPWLCYWMVHSLALMGGRLGEAETDRVVDFLLRCQSRTGGFGGGPGQLSHLATTYAAVNALVTLGSERGLRGIDRDNLYTWMLSVKEPTGEFHMHVDGEIDMRGCYCAMSVAKICNILTDELASNTAKWIASCQTYEGGISSLPGLEAHGGYTFCGLAALHILGQVPLLNLPRLTHWAARRQMAVEGGFQGRTNKLVDSCYSFWMGGIFPILSAWDDNLKTIGTGVADPCLFDRDALQEYVLACCEMGVGGFRDKPGKSRDFYHTCYASSGLSIAQHVYKMTTDPKKFNQVSSTVHVRGNIKNELELTDPVANIQMEKYAAGCTFFWTLGRPSSLSSL